MQLLIRCPERGQLVETGMVMDRRSFESCTLENNTLGCRHCGGSHTWSKGDVILSEDLKLN